MPTTSHDLIMRVLGIEHPVPLAPMDLVLGGKLAAVSQAEGLDLWAAATAKVDQVVTGMGTRRQCTKWIRPHPLDPGQPIPSTGTRSAMPARHALRSRCALFKMTPAVLRLAQTAVGKSETRSIRSAASLASAARRCIATSRRTAPCVGTGPSSWPAADDCSGCHRADVPGR